LNGIIKIEQEMQLIVNTTVQFWKDQTLV
jgi:hypothetical protein